MSAPYEGDSNSVGTAGLAGTNTTHGDAVFAKSAGGFGVHAVSTQPTGLDFFGGIGVYGEYVGPARDWKQIRNGAGVMGVTNSGFAIGVVARARPGMASTVSATLRSMLGYLLIMMQVDPVSGRKGTLLSPPWARTR
jgi:hypothetical protein